MTNYFYSLFQSLINMANIFIGTYDGNIIAISTQDYAHWTNQFFFKASQVIASSDIRISAQRLQEYTHIVRL